MNHHDRPALDKLTKLAREWYGYRGEGPFQTAPPNGQKHAWKRPDNTRSVPDIVPSTSGGLQLEWFVGQFEIELEIAPDVTDGKALAFVERQGHFEGRGLNIGASLVFTEIVPYFRALPQ